MVRVKLTRNATSGRVEYLHWVETLLVEKQRRVGSRTSVAILLLEQLSDSIPRVYMYLAA